jgi:glucokinase
MFLAGDIGGTKTVLALFEAAEDGLTQVREATFPSQGAATFESIFDQFAAIAPLPPLASACFGVAGPVIDGECLTTNLPWHLVETELAAYLKTRRVKLLNDLEAAAYGMLFLKPDELEVLNPGTEPHHDGNIAVIAAGTGLGEAFLYFDGEHFHPVASEGGHCDLAPQNSLEDELVAHLRSRFGPHVSCERVLSGPGFSHVYTFLREREGHRESPEVAAALTSGDPNATIARYGLAGTDPLCVETLDLFASIYGAEAGNLALKCMARSVYVGGGIAPKILPVLKRGGFLASFLAKGRLEPVMKGMRVSVALNPRAPLLGAANYARRI